MAKRSNNFAEKPDGGWLHDDTALAVGDEGIFYSFPVFYAGSIELKESLRGLDMNEQTDLTRELMATVAERAGIRNEKDREANPELRKKFKKFLSGKITLGQVHVSLCISATSLAIGPPQDATIKAASLSSYFQMYSMKTVSLSAGGELRDYDLVAFVAKDSSSRECHVFDCGNLCDEVLTTIGQAFVLAQQSQARSKKAALDSLYEKTGGASKDAKVSALDKKKAIVQGLNKMDNQRRSMKAPVLRSTGLVTKAAAELSPSEVEALRLREAEETAQNRPSWVCWSQAEEGNKISLDDLRKQFLSQAQVQEVIEVEED